MASSLVIRRVSNTGCLNSASSFSKNTVLLNLAIEAFKCGLKRFMVANPDFRHPGSPPHGPFSRFTRYRTSYTSWTCAEIIVQHHYHVKLFSPVVSLACQR